MPSYLLPDNLFASDAACSWPAAVSGGPGTTVEATPPALASDSACRMNVRVMLRCSAAVLEPQAASRTAASVTETAARRYRAGEAFIAVKGALSAASAGENSPTSATMEIRIHFFSHFP